MTTPAERLDALLADLAKEIARQDQRHPSGYPATRDGVFLGIMTAHEELVGPNEALGAWRQERCKCATPLCGHATWAKTHGELLQAAGVIMRTIRSIAENAAESEGPVSDTLAGRAHAAGVTPEWLSARTDQDIMPQADAAADMAGQRRPGPPPLPPVRNLAAELIDTGDGWHVSPEVMRERCP